MYWATISIFSTFITAALNSTSPPSVAGNATMVEQRTTNQAAAPLRYGFDTSVGSAAPPDTLGGYPMTHFGPDPQPDWYFVVGGVADPCPIPGWVGFETGLEHVTIGAGWSSWSHGYTGDAYCTGGATSCVLTLPQPACAFYFYAQPNTFYSVKTFTVTADDGSSTSFTANGSGGAAYCGVYGAAISTLRIACTTDFAIGEFGIACFCEPIYRACCTGEAIGEPVCTEGVDVPACIAESGRWDVSAELCSQLTPPCGEYLGACCEGETADPPYQPFQCIGDMGQWECLSAGETTTWTGGRSCADPAFLCPGQPGLLYAPASDDNWVFRAAVNALLGLPCDYYDARSGTPDLAFLQGYRAVLTWTNYPYADNVAFGNVLADYVDAGGRVILGQWCLPTGANFLAGRIMTADYCPALAASFDYGPWTYNGDGHMCATAGLTSLSAPWLDQVSYLQPGAISDGTIGNGIPLAIWRADMAVWYSPGNCGGAYWGGHPPPGDWAILTYNEVVCLPVPGACCDISTGECLDETPVLDCLAMGPTWQYHLGMCGALVPECGDPGACCFIHTGECADNVLHYNCAGEQFTSGQACAELTPLCGDPGCCCDWPEPGLPPSPHVEFRANCSGRFVSGALGTDCSQYAFQPPCPPSLYGVLYCPSGDDNPTFRSQLSTLLGGDPVDYFDARTATPTVEMLSQYAAAFTWCYLPYADRVQMGDNLADYVDLGGRVILGQRCYDTGSSSLYLDGRIMSDPAYCPIAGGACSGGPYQPGAICATAGVTDLGYDVASFSDLQPGAMWDGAFGDCPAVIWNAAGNVWYSPGNTAGRYGGIRDWALLTYNEATCQSAPGPCCYVYTAECMDDLYPLDCSAHGAGWQWYPAPSCAAMDPPCGDPGCCCSPPEEGVLKDPVESLRANCDGRFLSGLTGEDCVAEAFTPECGMVKKYLYAPSYADDPSFRSQLSALLYDQAVDYFDTRSATPSVDDLSQYAAVFTWCAYAYADSVVFGNNLADYVDQGGRVILGMWCLDGLDGRIMTTDYCPVTGMYSTLPSDFYYNGDGSQCATTGVWSLCTHWLDGITGLRPGAQYDGTLYDGFPLAVWNAPMSVWYSTGNLGGTDTFGDWEILTANEMACTPPLGACCNIRTGECLDAQPAPDCFDMGASWRTHPGVSCASLAPPCGDPGACCDPVSGACLDDVYRENCVDLNRQSTSGAACGELHPPCGDPGCCCDYPESGQVTDPHFTFHANCHGRFIAGAYPLCGDLDENGIVDMDDYNLFLTAFGKCAGQPGYVAAADLDGDDCVDLVDFQTWRNCYLYQGTGCTADMFTPACGL